MSRWPAWLVWLGMSAVLGGQTARPGARLTLAGAVAQASTHAPSVEAAQAAAQRAQADTGVAETAFLPTAGVAAQFDRATDNATRGLTFSSPLPGISGSVIPQDYSQRSAWTSAAGVYFSWEVADFGRRAANVRYYRELAAQAAAQSDLARLQAGAHAGDAYLTVLAAREQQRLAEADRQRWQQITTIIEALVEQQLRPGADASRARAELAGAQIRVANAARNVANAEATLREALGTNGPLPELETPPAEGAPGPMSAQLAAHPQARAQAEAVAAVEARQQELAHSALPRTSLLGAAYGRGTGAVNQGVLATGLTGLAPVTAANWAVGLSVDFSFTRWRTTRAQEAAARAQHAQEAARSQQVSLALADAWERAQADLAAAREVALQSPVELAAAQAGEAQARVRYQTGLAGVVDLANAEQLLLQAESDQAMSGLQVWRGLLESGYAAGDLGGVLPGGH